MYLDAEGELLRQGVTAGPALIKPNQAELSGVMGRPLTTEDETIRAAQELLAQGVGCVAVTMGAGGALLCWEDCVLRCESPRVPVGSTVGAGDSVVAALAYAQQRQLSREDTAASLWRRARPTSCAPARRRPGLVTSNSSCRRCASPDCELFTISLPVFETLFKIFRYTLNIRSEINRSVLFCIFRRCARLMPRKYLRISRQPCA